MSAHVADSPGPLQSTASAPLDVAAHFFAQEAIEQGEVVVAGDAEGHAVTVDIYAHGLNAATRHYLHPVRVLTAAIDVLRGKRDYYRGPKKVQHPNYTPWLAGSVVE